MVQETSGTSSCDPIKRYVLTVPTDWLSGRSIDYKLGILLYYIKLACSLKLWTAHCQRKADTIKDILTHVRLHVLIKGTYCKGYFIYSCSDKP